MSWHALACFPRVGWWNWVVTVSSGLFRGVEERGFTGSRRARDPAPSPLQQAIGCLQVGKPGTCSADWTPGSVPSHQPSRRSHPPSRRCNPASLSPMTGRYTPPRPDPGTQKWNIWRSHKTWDSTFLSRIYKLIELGWKILILSISIKPILIIKGLVNLKKKILLLITHLYVVPNP